MVIWTISSPLYGQSKSSTLAVHIWKRFTIFIILNLYLYFEEGNKFWKNYLKIGKSGILGGSGLGIAMISFIYSITNTTAAITLLCLAAMPFFTALLAFIFLKEQISINVWISIFIATIGIIIIGFWKHT